MYRKEKERFRKRYKISSNVIGSGTYSTIYLGTDTQDDNREVAVKHIDTRHLTYQEKRHIMMEISILKKINHGNIVQYIDSYIGKTRILIVLEYCPDGNLHDHIKCGAITEQDARNIFIQIVDALKYLHSHDIFHRDIKPTNILLVDECKVKLIDFGLATENKNMSSTMCGSPLYMAPEILLSNKYTNTCDIWSLGVVLYEMLFQKVPFSACNIYELQCKHLNETDLPNMKGISANCKNLLHSMLSKNSRITWKQLYKHPWVVTETKDDGEDDTATDQEDTELFVFEESITNSTFLNKYMLLDYFT